MQRRNVSYSNEKKWIPFPKVILCTSKGTIKVTRSENYVFINVILTRSLQCAWLLIANVFFRFIGKFFTFYGISQSYMSSLKCGHSFFMWIPHLISTVQPRLRYKFSQLSIDSNFGFSNVGFGQSILPIFSQFMKGMQNLDIWVLD